MTDSLQDDKVLVTALVISIGALCYFVPKILQYVKDDAIAQSSEEKPTKPLLHEDCEAAIGLPALEILANGPSYPLASSAIRITARRFAKHAKSQQRLWTDLAGDDRERRDSAIQTLQLLFTNPALKEFDAKRNLIDDHAYKAIVNALVKLLPEHCCDGKAVPVSPVAPLHRPAQEVVLLELLVQLLEQTRSPRSQSYNTDSIWSIINAGIVTRYLQYYPFPCALAAYNSFNFKKQDVFNLLNFNSRGADDRLMSRLVYILATLPAGNQQLIDAGLKEPDERDRSEVSYHDSDRASFRTARRTHRPYSEEMTNGAIPSDEILEMTAEDNQLRSDSNMTAAERSRHRRHRQAVVVSDSDGTLNILERQPTATELDWRQPM